MSLPQDLLPLALLFSILPTGQTSAEESSPAPDISAVSPDLVLPPLTDDAPGAGKRVRHSTPDTSSPAVYHVLYLPVDWEPGKEYPVIVEYAGNGPYANAIGDISTGLVEGSSLGYGLSRGQGCIWLCLPYLNEAGTENVRQWWGDKPTRDPSATIAYCKKIVPWICETFGGDHSRVLLCGFSRGAIACHFIGLHDDEISRLWCGFLAYSHFDGVHAWPFPGSDQEAARGRLARLLDRPLYLLHENTSGQGLSLLSSFDYLKKTGVDLKKARFRETGFRNHNDAWILRPSEARRDVRTWVETVLQIDR